MFKQSFLRQAHQFSSQRLITTNATTYKSTPRLTTPTIRRWKPVHIYARTVWRAFSVKLKGEKVEEKEVEQEVPTKDGTEKTKEPISIENAKLSKELEEIQVELDIKTKEAKDLKDKFARAVADFRNLQYRTERDKKSARDFAIQNFAKDLVDSVDNLERALDAVPEESRTNPKKNKELVDFYNGLKMTEEILLNTLKKHGLEKVDPVGEEFDPNKHEATFQVPVPDKKPNTVFHVQQTGFVLNGRTIRAAKVGVVAVSAP